MLAQETNKILPRLKRISGGASVWNNDTPIDGNTGVPMMGMLGSHSEHKFSTDPFDPCAKSRAPGAHEDPKNSLSNVP